MYFSKKDLALLPRYYRTGNQNKILALENGTWEHFLKLGPAWKNRPLQVLIVRASEQASSILQGAIDGEGLKPLPNNVTKLATLNLNVH